MAKILCVLYGDPIDGNPTSYLRDSLPHIERYPDGNKVIYLRHATTDQRQVDTGRLGDRSGQRNLTPEGIRQAENLGRALRALRVPLNEILASPVFRAAYAPPFSW